MPDDDNGVLDTAAGLLDGADDAAGEASEQARNTGKGMLGGAAVIGGVAAIGGAGYYGLTREGREPSFLRTAAGPAVSDGASGIANFARQSDENGKLVGWVAMGMVGMLGLSLAPTIGQVGMGQMLKSLLSTAAVIAVTVVAGMSLATWAQRGFEGGFMGFVNSFLDTSADVVEMLHIDDMIKYGTVPGWTYMAGKAALDAINGDDVEQEFGTVTIGEGEDAVTQTNDERIVNIPEGQEVNSYATGRIVMASAEGVDGDDRSIVVIESPNGVYTVLRGMDGVTEDLVGQQVETGEPIEGVTSSGQLGHQQLVTYVEEGDPEGTFKATLVDPRYPADHLAQTRPEDRVQAIEEAGSEVGLGEVVPSTLFEEHILPIIHQYGRPAHGFGVYQRGSGHCASYETEEDAPLIARDDMEVLHVEGNTMIVRYGDGEPATYGVYNNVNGIDESLVGQTFEAGQEIEGTQTGGRYDYSLVVEAEEDGQTVSYVVDPLRYSPDQMTDDAEARQNAIDHTKETVAATHHPLYDSHIKQLAAGNTPASEVPIGRFGTNDGYMSVGVGLATQNDGPMVSSLSGTIIAYDTISDAEAAADDVDNIAQGEGLLIAHSEEAGVYSQIAGLKSVDESGGTGLEIASGDTLPATTDTYTERRLIVVDPRDGQPYFVDPEEFNDIQRLVDDREYRIEAIDAAKEAVGNDPAYVAELQEMDYEIPEIEVTPVETEEQPAPTGPRPEESMPANP